MDFLLGNGSKNELGSEKASVKYQVLDGALDPREKINLADFSR